MATGFLAMTNSTGGQTPKFLGNIWKTSWGSPPASFAELFNQVTPENAGKWKSAEKVKGQFIWSPLDSMYVWAEKSGAVTK